MCFSEIEFKKRSCWIAQDILLFLLWTSDTLPVQSSCFAPEMIYNDSKEAEFEPPGLAKIFFSDIQSVTLNYHTPSLIWWRGGRYWWRWWRQWWRRGCLMETAQPLFAGEPILSGRPNCCSLSTEQSIELLLCSKQSNLETEVSHNRSITVWYSMIFHKHHNMILYDTTLLHTVRSII